MMSSEAMSGEIPSTSATSTVAYRDADHSVVSCRLVSVDSSISRKARSRSALDLVGP